MLLYNLKYLKKSSQARKRLRCIVFIYCNAKIELNNKYIYNIYLNIITHLYRYVLTY